MNDTRTSTKYAVLNGFRVETVSPTGHVTSDAPVLTAEQAQALADAFNKEFGQRGFRSQVKQGAFKPCPLRR